MKTVYWDSVDTNLGRFGIVRRGDILNLSDDEAAMVQRDKDKRFKPYTDGAKLPEPIEDESAANQDRAEQAAAAQDEKDRKERLAKENAPQNVFLVEVASMDREKLLGVVKRLNEQGHQLKITDKMGTIAIRAAIMQSTRAMADREQEPEPEKAEPSNPDGTTGTPDADKSAPPSIDQLADMTKAQLIDYAKSIGVEIGNGLNKVQIMEALAAAMNKPE